MISHTNAFLRYKSQGKTMFDFVVIACYAMPNFNNQLNDNRSGLINNLLPPDYFINDQSTLDDLLQKGNNYQNILAAYVTLSSFSYFEAYISDAINEMITFHGGVERFRNRALASMANTNPEVLMHKRKLQEPIKNSKIQKYIRHTQDLKNAGYQFPSDLISSYGFYMLKDKVDKMRAAEIPKLLKESLQLNLSARTETRFNDIRIMRNNVAHGNPGTITLREAMQASKDLHALAVTIDKHLVEHFFIINEYVIP